MASEDTCIEAPSYYHWTHKGSSDRIAYASLCACESLATKESTEFGTIGAALGCAIRDGVNLEAVVIELLAASVEKR
jgi:hypothetical protein